MPPKPSPLRPIIRIAPFGELDAYPVYTHELDQLAAGSPGSQLLGIAYALIGFAGALAIAIFGTDIPSNRAYDAFVMGAMVTGLGGVVCLALGVKGFQGDRALVAKIKSRMPPTADPIPAPPSPPVPPTP